MKRADGTTDHIVFRIHQVKLETNAELEALDATHSEARREILRRHEERVNAVLAEHREVAA